MMPRDGGPCGSTGLAALCSGPTSTVHQWMVLPFFCGSPDLGEHAPHDERTTDGGGVDRLLLEADLDQIGGQRLGVRAGAQLHVLGEPGQGDARHQMVPSSWRENRTSPSTMSYMSPIPCRSMSVRSMPIPKA